LPIEIEAATPLRGGLGLWARRTAGGYFAGRLVSCLFPSSFGSTPAIRPNALPPRAILLAKSRFTSVQYADLPPFRGFASWNAHSPSAPLAVQCPTSPAACRCSCLRLEPFARWWVTVALLNRFRPLHRRLPTYCKQLARQTHGTASPQSTATLSSSAPVCTTLSS
jgi:hypothetical protein